MILPGHFYTMAFQTSSLLEIILLSLISQIIRSNLFQIMIDTFVLSSSQFRATFPFWQWLINQTSPLLGCSPWQITLKLLREVISQRRGLCV